MVDQRNDVISYIQKNGPVLPVQIAKHIDTNILFASAILAELVERKSLKITHFSVGGSPLYFLEGQENLMDKRLSQSLSGKEKEAYQLIKENKVVREEDLQPWERVAIKSLKDFTVSVTVTAQDKNEIFWKYHLVSEEEAQELIQKTIDELYDIKEEPTVHEEILKEPELLQTNEIKITKPEIQVIKQTQQNSDDIVKEIAEKLKSELLREIKPKRDIKKIEKPKEEKIIKKKEVKPSGKFYDNVIGFLKENKIRVLGEETIRKDKEFDFLIEMSSAFGNLKYFLKAKEKSSITDSDVSMTFSQAQDRKLPILYLVRGKISKKATNLADTKLKGQITLKQI